MASSKTATGKKGIKLLKNRKSEQILKEAYDAAILLEEQTLIMFHARKRNSPSTEEVIMINSVGSSGGYDTSVYVSRIINRLDTNGDGKIDSTELQALSGDDNSFDSTAVLAGLDGNDDGAIDTEELASALEKLGVGGAGKTMHRPPPPDPAEMFAAADTDGSGGIDMDEFAASGPGFADQQQIATMFASIDTDGNGSIDKSENETALTRMGPPPPPQGQEKTATSGEQTGQALFTAADNNTASVLQQLLDVLKSSDYGAEDEDDDAVQSVRKLVMQLQISAQYSQKGSISTASNETVSLFSTTG